MPEKLCPDCGNKVHVRVRTCACMGEGACACVRVVVCMCVWGGVDRRQVVLA